MNTKPDRTRDRHRSNFMVRVPEVFRTKLQLLKEKTGKPITSLVQWGLKLLLRRFGLWKKEDDRELELEQQPASKDVRGEERIRPAEGSA